MLYQLYDLQEALLTPVRFAAGATQLALQNPLSPVSYTRMGRALAAGAELFERTTRRYAKPAFGLDATEVEGERVAVFERVVMVRPFCSLLHFEREGGPPPGPRVLVVAPLSGHHATLLRGTVEALLPHHDVYITDWHDARLVPLWMGGFGFDDYVDEVIRFMRHLGPDLHVIAVCQPAVQVLAATSLMAQAKDPCQPRTITLMGGPIDPRAAETQVTRLAVDKPLTWFEQTVIATVPAYYPGAFRRVYPGFIQLTGFMSMNLDRHIGEHWKLFQHLVSGDGESAEAHRKFYDEYLSVMDLPAEFYLQTVYRVFQKHLLPRGELMVRGVRVEPAAIRRTALLTVEGERDDISAVGQTAAAHDLCSGLSAEQKRRHLQPQVGHYGIFNGSRWRREIRPIISDFIHTHQPAARRTHQPATRRGAALSQAAE